MRSTSSVVDSWTERENDCDDVRFSRLLDAVDAGYRHFGVADTIV